MLLVLAILCVVMFVPFFCRPNPRLSRRQEFSFSRASTIIASAKFIVRSFLPACGLFFAEAEGAQKGVYGPAPLSQQQDSLQDLQQLGWGVTLHIDLPQEGPGRKATVLKAPDSDLIIFKETKWMGVWRGYYFTTIEHEGSHLTGYKLDQATEPREKFEGPKPNKYFGVVNGVLGYHFDTRGPPPSSDPASDKKLLEMGWGKGADQKPADPEKPPSAPEGPETSQATPKTPQPAPATPQTGPGGSVEVKQERLTEAKLKELQLQKAQDFGNTVKAPPSADEKATMSRRACYNLLDRIRKNPNRLKLLDPKFREQLLTSEQTAVPGDLVTQLFNAGGDLQAVNATFSVAHEIENLDMDVSKLKPFTELQVKARYGDEAKQVMKFKEQQGLTKDDPNCPGKKVYMMVDESRLGVCFATVIKAYRSSSVEHGRV